VRKRERDAEAAPRSARADIAAAAQSLRRKRRKARKGLSLFTHTRTEHDDVLVRFLGAVHAALELADERFSREVGQCHLGLCFWQNGCSGARRMRAGFDEPGSGERVI
jgi:hypothetical protein